MFFGASLETAMTMTNGWQAKPSNRILQTPDRIQVHRVLENPEMARHFMLSQQQLQDPENK